MLTKILVLSACSIGLLAPRISAGDFVFQDSDCAVMSPTKDKISVRAADKSEYTCVVIGGEASCNYRSLTTGKSQGQPTKFEVVAVDGIQIWSSMATGNVKIVVDEKTKRFYYGMTTILESGVIVSKQCLGKIVRQAD